MYVLKTEEIMTVDDTIVAIQALPEPYKPEPKYRPVKWPEDHGKQCRDSNTPSLTGIIIGKLPNEKFAIMKDWDNRNGGSAWYSFNIEVLDE
jgi:hypothetical protein